MRERANVGTVSTDLLRILLGSAPLADGELSDILELIGIEPNVLDRSQHRLSTRHLATIWTEMERTAEDPDLGLHIGELRDGVPPGHVLFSAMLNSPTVGHALERYCRFHDIMGDFVQPLLVERNSTTVLRLSTRGDVALHRQHVECIFCLILSILSHVSTAKFVGKVRFVHERPASIAEHRRLLGSTPTFEQSENELEFDRAYLEQPIAASDAELLGVLDQYAERLLRRIRPESTWSAKVVELLSRILCNGKPNLAQVARQLAVSQRSLQEKLKAEGTTYQAVLNSVRLQLATDALDNTELSLAEVAFLLGYADQSAFNHAFRKWTGKSPSRFRDRQGTHDAFRSDE